MLLDAVKRCQASLFTDRAISYRIDQGFDHFKVFLSVAVMQMVRTDRAASGVMFTIDTESGHPDVVFITAAWGLGENVVQGAVDPDEFYVHKPTLQGRAPLRAAQAPRAQADPHGLRRRQHARAGAQPADAGRGPRALLPERRRRAGTRRRRASRSRITTAAWPAAGGRWTSNGRRTAPTARSTSCRRGPRRSVSQRAVNVIEEFVLEGKGPVRVAGPVGRRAHRQRPRAANRRRAASWHLFEPGEVLVADTTDARLGAGDEDGRRDRHQPRRAHLPCGDRRARARHPGGGRHRGRDASGCRTARRSPSPAPRATSATSTRAGCRSSVDEQRPHRLASARAPR